MPTSLIAAPFYLQADLVDEAIRSTNERYSNMNPEEFASLKQALQHGQSAPACFAAAHACPQSVQYML